MANDRASVTSGFLETCHRLGRVLEESIAKGRALTQPEAGALFGVTAQTWNAHVNDLEAEYGDVFERNGTKRTGVFNRHGWELAMVGRLSQAAVEVLSTNLAETTREELLRKSVQSLRQELEDQYAGDRLLDRLDKRAPPIDWKYELEVHPAAGMRVVGGNYEYRLRPGSPFAHIGLPKHRPSTAKPDDED